MTAKELNNYFLSNIVSVSDDEKHIKYSILTEILTEIKNNKITMKKESFEDFKNLSMNITNFFKELIFNGSPAKLVTSQETYNGVWVIENSIINTYKDSFSFGPGSEDDHLDMHTGTGKPGVDFVLSKPFTFYYFNQGVCELELLEGTKIDSKSFYSRDSMDSHLKENSTGRFGHYGDYMLAYLLIEKCWYLIENNTNKVFPLLNFKTKFDNSLLKFSLDSDGLLEIKDFNC